MHDFWQTIVLTFQLATVTTIILLVVGLPFAYWLSCFRSRWKIVVEALVSMPLVLPPTVLGFYLLVLLNPQGVIGQWLNDWLGIQLVFTFGGLVVGSVVYSFPFMVQSIQAGFESLPQQLSEAAYTLGKNKWQTFRLVLLPNIKPAILTGVVLSFAHTIGEFGVILMIGGNIPGKTRVASIAIFDEVERLNYTVANQYALFLIVFAFFVLVIVYNRKYKNR